MSDLSFYLIIIIIILTRAAGYLCREQPQYFTSNQDSLTHVKEEANNNLDFKLLLVELS